MTSSPTSASMASRSFGPSAISPAAVGHPSGLDRRGRATPSAPAPCSPRSRAGRPWRRASGPRAADWTSWSAARSSGACRVTERLDREVPRLAVLLRGVDELLEARGERDRGDDAHDPGRDAEDRGAHRHRVVRPSPRSTAKRTPSSVVAPKSQCSARGASLGGAWWSRVASPTRRSARQAANANAPTTSHDHGDRADHEHRDVDRPPRMRLERVDAAGREERAQRDRAGEGADRRDERREHPGQRRDGDPLPGGEAQCEQRLAARPRSWSTWRAAACSTAIDPGEREHAPRRRAGRPMIALRVLSSACGGVRRPRSTSGTSAPTSSAAIALLGLARGSTPGASRNSTPGEPGGRSRSPASSDGPT